MLNLIPSQVTEEMHVAACKVLARADGMDGLPQRMLDAMLAAAPGSVAQEPVYGDVLPAVGTRVFILHGRDRDAHPCIVTGYYVWNDLGVNKNLHRIFVRLLYEGSLDRNARLLSEVYPTEAAALAASAAIHGVAA